MSVADLPGGEPAHGQGQDQDGEHGRDAARRAASSSAGGDAQTPGELLRHERERRGWSIQQAAEDLHLDAAIVQAIEANRFQALGAPVYAKGHLRKYAEVLGLPPEHLVERYEALSDTPIVPVPVPAGRVAWRRPERPSLKLPLSILALLAALALGWWLFGSMIGAR